MIGDLKRKLYHLSTEAWLKSKQYSWLFYDRGRNGFRRITPERRFLLASSHRSGSTWLSNIIESIGNFRVIFEPFHVKEVPGISHFLTRQYLRADDERANYIEPVNRILNGELHSHWTDWQSKRLESRLLLVKTVRANLLLSWIKAHFPDVRLILLMRHPCAVAHSALSLKWQRNLEVFTRQQTLMEDHLALFRDYLLKTTTLFECSIYQWCIENYVPLKTLSKDDVFLVYYEELCTEPKRIITELSRYMGLKLNKNVWKIVRQPSLTSRSDSAVRSGTDLIKEWQQMLTDEEKRTARRITAHFGMDRIYDSNGMPDRRETEKLLEDPP